MTILFALVYSQLCALIESRIGQILFPLAYIEYFDFVVEQNNPFLNSFSRPYIFVDCLDIWIKCPYTLKASTHSL